MQMKLSKRLDDEESKEYWEFVEKTAEEVAKWPSWLFGDDRAGNVKERESAKFSNSKDEGYNLPAKTTEE
jgi:hypothetical protein